MKRLLLILCLLPLMARADLSTDLAAYWPLDETSGTRDDSVGSYDLTPLGTDDEYVAGKIGNAARFRYDGDDHLAKSGTNLFLGSDSDFTVAFWAMIDQHTGVKAVTLAELFTIAFRVGVDGTASGNHFNFEVGNGTTSASVTSTDTYTVGLGTYFFVVAWHDKTANKIYIQINDGTPDETAWSGGTLATSDRFEVGHDTAGSVWNGGIDEVGVWLRTLTSGERTALYNAGAGITYPFGPGAPKKTHIKLP